MTCTFVLYMLVGGGLAWAGWRGWRKRRLLSLRLEPKTARWGGAALLVCGVSLALAGLTYPWLSQVGGWLFLGAVASALLTLLIINMELLRRSRKL